MRRGGIRSELRVPAMPDGSAKWWDGKRIDSVSFLYLFWGWYRVKINGRRAGWLHFRWPADFRGLAAILSSGEREKGHATVVVLEGR